MNWHQHNGGSCPVDEDAIVRVEYRCGYSSEREHRAGSLNWRHRDWDFDVVAYAVLSVPDDKRRAA